MHHDDFNNGLCAVPALIFLPESGSLAIDKESHSLPVLLDGTRVVLASILYMTCKRK